MNMHQQTPVWSGAHKAGLAGLLLVQFAAAYVIGTGHLLTNDQHSLIMPIAITAFINRSQRPDRWVGLYSL